MMAFRLSSNISNDSTPFLLFLQLVDGANLCFCFLRSRLVLWRSRSSTAGGCPRTCSHRLFMSVTAISCKQITAIINGKYSKKTNTPAVVEQNTKIEYRTRVRVMSRQRARSRPLPIYTGNSGMVAKATHTGRGGQRRCAPRCDVCASRRTDASRLPENKLHALFGTASSTPPSVRVKNASHTSRLNSSSLYYHRIIVW